MSARLCMCQRAVSDGGEQQTRMNCVFHSSQDQEDTQLFPILRVLHGFVTTRSTKSTATTDSVPIWGVDSSQRGVPLLQNCRFAWD